MDLNDFDTIEKCKSKINSMRTQYRLERKKVLISQYASPYQSTLVWFKMMDEFLQPYVKLEIEPYLEESTSMGEEDDNSGQKSEGNVLESADTPAGNSTSEASATSDSLAKSLADQLIELYIQNAKELEQKTQFLINKYPSTSESQKHH